MLVDAAAAPSIRCNIGGRRRQKYRHNNFQLIIFCRTLNLILRDLFKIQLDPVSRVTGIPRWYWILGIKCSDTTGVGLVYWNSELKSGQGHTPISNIGMLCMQELFFVGWVDDLKHCKWSTFLPKERRVLTRKRTEMSNYLTHRYFEVDYGRLCVLCE